MFLFPLSLPRLLPDLAVYISNRRVFYKKQELITLRERLNSPAVFVGVRVAHLFSILCCVVCLVLFVFVLCRVPNVASFSRLPILFLIAPSVFSNVYAIQQKEFAGQWESSK